MYGAKTMAIGNFIYVTSLLVHTHSLKRDKDGFYVFFSLVMVLYGVFFLYYVLEFWLAQLIVTTVRVLFFPFLHIFMRIDNLLKSIHFVSASVTVHG